MSAAPLTPATTWYRVRTDDNRAILSTQDRAWAERFARELCRGNVTVTPERLEWLEEGARRLLDAAQAARGHS